MTTTTTTTATISTTAVTDNGTDYVPLTKDDFCYLNDRFPQNPELDTPSLPATKAVFLTAAATTSGTCDELDSKPKINRWMSYRPFTAEVMINTSDARDDRSLRSRTFEVLNAMALGVSAVTAVAIRWRPC